MAQINVNLPDALLADFKVTSEACNRNVSSQIRSLIWAFNATPFCVDALKQRDADRAARRAKMRAHAAHCLAREYNRQEFRNDHMDLPDEHIAEWLAVWDEVVAAAKK